MKFAKRMDRFGEGIFSRLAEIKNKRISEGKEVIDLSIGAPNIPPAEHIRKALCEEAMKPENYVYAISDTKKLLDTVATGIREDMMWNWIRIQRFVPF